MKLEEAYVAEVTKLMEHEDIKEDQQIQTVRTKQQNTSSTMLQIAKKPHERITEGNRRNRGQHGKERWRGKRMHGNRYVTWKKILLDN